MTIAATFLEEQGQNPAEIATLLAQYLSAATTSLAFAIYDFRLSPALAEPVVEALRDRAAAGVKVRIAYDAGKQSTPFQEVHADPAQPGTAQFLASLDPRIELRAITGGDPLMPKLMHQKYIVRDGGMPGGAVWTGSTNFTDDSWALQENNIVRLETPELCRYYMTDFEELWQRGDIGTTGQHDRGTVTDGTARIEVAFAPGEGRAIDHEIAACVSRTRRRLRICSMLITSGAILGAVRDLLRQGRIAEHGGIYDATQMETAIAQWQGTPSAWKVPAFREVSRDLIGKRSTPYHPGSRHDFMHNKVLVSDDCVITGSYNLSSSATVNAENVVMIHDPELANRYSAYVDHLTDRYSHQA